MVDMTDEHFVRMAEALKRKRRDSMPDMDDEPFVRTTEEVKQELAQRDMGFIRSAQDVKAHCIGCGKTFPLESWHYLWCEDCRTVPTIELLRARDFPPCICPIPCIYCGWQESSLEGFCGCQSHR